MHLYQYACPVCQRDCELLIRGEERPVCPAYGGRRLSKLLSVPAAHASGSKVLPLCSLNPRTDCGLPQCGTGGCMLE